MALLTFTDREGACFTVDVEAGISVMEAIRASGQGDIMALCGGVKSCATCHVYVNDDWLDHLPPIDEDEDDLLDASPDRRRKSRLSCQIAMSDALAGLAVTIAPEA